MGSTIDSSISATSGALDFESGGCSRKDTEEIFQAVGYVSNDLWAILAPEHLPASAPQALEAPGCSRLPGSGRLDKLYEPYFQQLELGLEALKAQQHIVPELPKVVEGNVSAQSHVPSSETQCFVPKLDVVDVKAEGGVAFGSALVEWKAPLRK